MTTRLSKNEWTADVDQEQYSNNAHTVFPAQSEQKNSLFCIYVMSNEREHIERRSMIKFLVRKNKTKAKLWKN